MDELAPEGALAAALAPEQEAPAAGGEIPVDAGAILDDAGEEEDEVIIVLPDDVGEEEEEEEEEEIGGAAQAAQAGGGGGGMKRKPAKRRVTVMERWNSLLDLYEYTTAGGVMTYSVDSTEEAFKTFENERTLFCRLCKSLLKGATNWANLEVHARQPTQLMIKVNHNVTTKMVTAAAAISYSKYNQLGVWARWGGRLGGCFAISISPYSSIIYSLEDFWAGAAKYSYIFIYKHFIDNRADRYQLFNSESESPNSGMPRSKQAFSAFSVFSGVFQVGNKPC